MIRANSEIKKIQSYLDNLKLDSTSLSGKSIDVPKIYRRFHGLLLYSLLIEKNEKADSAKDFARESVADCSNSFFLTLINFYKPALLSLRSSIENILRYLLASNGVNLNSIVTVYELFSSAKALYPLGSMQRPFIDRLHTQYAILCRSSHTVRLNEMSLEIPFSKLSAFKATKAKENGTRLDQVFTSILNLLFCNLHNSMHLLGAVNADAARSVIPRSLRRAVTD